MYITIFAHTMNSNSIKTLNMSFCYQSNFSTIQNIFTLILSRKFKRSKISNISKFAFFVKFLKMQNLRMIAKKIHAQRKNQKKIQIKTN